MKTLFEGKKLYAVIIAFLLMITFFITLHIIRNHYQHVFRNVITENTLTANLLSTLLYEHQKAATSILESYARRPLFIDAVKKKDFHRAIYHLKSLSEHHTETDALFITDQSGTIWANYPVSKESYGKNLAYRDWYKGVSKKWRPYISTVFRLIVLEKDLAVALSVPVFDRKGKVIGILGSTQRTLFLATFIKENTIDPRKSIALLDQEGNIIFSNALPYQEKITKYPDAHVLEKAGAEVVTDMEIADAKEKGSISYVSIAPVRGIGWSVIVGQEKNAILKSLYGYFIRSAVAGFVIFLFLTVSLLYFRREYKYRKTKELLQAEEKYRNIFENTVEGIYRTTPEGRFIIINPAFAAICGYASPEEMIEKVTDIPNQLYANPEDRLRLQKRIAAEEKVKGFEVQFKTSTRGLVWVSIHAKALRDEQGNIRHYDGTIEDVTERKRGEEALRKSEENFRRSLDESPLGVRIVTIEGETIYANRAMLNIYRYDSIEELRTTPLKERYTPGSYAEFQIRKKKRQQGEHDPSEYEVSIVRKDGEVRHLQVFRKDVLWDGERQFQVLYNDITERKRAEEALKKSVQLLRDTGEMAKVGGWELDLSTNVVSWTEEVNKIHGTGPGYKPKLEEALNFYAPESRPALEEALKKAAETGVPYDLESLFIPSGSKDKIWVRSLGRAVYSGGKIVKLVGTFQNIDKYKREEEALRESEEQFRVAQELSPDGFTILRPIRDAQERVVDFTWVYENATIARLNGTDPKAVVGRRLLELFPGHSGSQFLRAYQLVAESGEHCVFEADYCGDSITKPTWFRIAVVPMGGDIAILAQDITERKRMEEEKHRMEERSHKLVDDVFRFIPEGVLVFSRKMELLRQNQAFRELVSGYARRLGFAEDELENLIIDKVKAGLRDNNIKEIKIARKHETGEQT